MLHLEAHMRCGHSDLPNMRRNGIGLFYRAAPVLFLRREKSRNSEKWKNGFETFAFLGVPKISNFSRKTNADATTVGSGPGRLALVCMRELTFPLGEIKFPLGEIVFPLAELTFPLGELTFPLGEIKFPLREIKFPLVEIKFPLGEIKFPLRELTFPLREIAFLVTEFTFPSEGTQVSASDVVCKVSETVHIEKNSRAMNLKKSVPNFWNVSNQKSCFCAWKKMFRAQKTKFYTSFF